MSAVLIALLLSLVGREVWGWLPMFSRFVIWPITVPLARERRRRRRTEWGAELKAVFDERRLAGLVWTVKLSGVCAFELVTRLRERLSLSWFAPATLRQLPPSERMRWRALAMTVLLLAVFAGVAFALAVSTALGMPAWIAALIGIGWGIVVLMLERLVHMLPPGGGGTSGLWQWRFLTLLVVLPRLALSVLLALATAQPLMLRLFDREITVAVGHSNGVSLIDRMHALSTLAAAYPTLRVMQIGLQLVCVLLFTMPLITGLYARRSHSAEFRLYV